MNLFRNLHNLDQSKYTLAEYYVESKTNLRDAAWALAVGQSVGNPNLRNSWETDELFENHSCMIIGDERQLQLTSNGNITIAFPVANTDFKTDGVSHLLCQLMGGQLDIDLFKKCQLLDLDIPEKIKNNYFLGPKFGINGIREYTNCHDKPIFGGIIKPKTGVAPDVLLKMVEEMVEGGVNFIKEDEIMANPAVCPINIRVPLIMDYLKDKNVIYAVCINSDPMHVIDRVKKVYELGANAIHINFWSGLGVYKSIRELDLPLFVHFQKSGDKILTNKNHQFHISWHVICELAGLMGVDFIHAGMWGGYLSDSEKELATTLKILRDRNVMPALSCGMHAGLIEAINSRFGINYMANVGGAIHGHPQGSCAGASAIRQSIDRNYKDEYTVAISKWGIVK